MFGFWKAQRTHRLSGLGKRVSYGGSKSGSLFADDLHCWLQRKEDKLEFIPEGFQNGSISMRAFKIG
jgi:hypothetical protein